VTGEPEVWIPLAVPASTAITDDATWYLNHTVARLAPGATLEQAERQVRAFAAEMRALMDQSLSEGAAASATVRPLRAYVAGDVGPVMWAALGAVSLVLLIACANVANLLLARGDRRQGDLAVRAALGADRRRILRSLLLEGTLLGA